MHISIMLVTKHGNSSQSIEIGINNNSSCWHCLIAYTDKNTESQVTMDVALFFAECSQQ